MSGDTLAQMRERLASLGPTHLHVEDESHLHAGHAGARSGGGHYRLEIVATVFAGKNTVARHRLIYDALGDMMRGAIHALSINAQAPQDV